MKVLLPILHLPLRILHIFSRTYIAYILPFQSWICAGRECFFTWAFLGGVMTQLSSHNRFRHNAARDAAVVAVLTLGALVLSGVAGVAMVQMVNNSGYEYTVSSFGESN